MPAAPPKEDNPQNERLRVFLSYSWDDSPVVSKLYDLLRSVGAEPWIDRRNSTFGEDLQEEISKAIRRADAVVVCLSQSPLTARRADDEIRFAAELAKTRKGDAPKLIPVRLEECPVPEELASFHRVDLFDERGFFRLTEALHDLARKLNKTLLTTTHRREPSETFASTLAEWSKARKRAADAARAAGNGVASQPPGAERRDDLAEQSGAAGKVGKEDGGAAIAETVEPRGAPAEGLALDDDSYAQAAFAGSTDFQASGTVTTTPRVVKAGLDESARSRSATNDKPLDDVERDTLGFRDFVFALRDFIVSQDTTTPLTISVNGAWGSGKSSLMGMLQKQLEAPPPGLWRAKLEWLWRWARGTPVALAGRLLAWSEHWDCEYIRLGLSFDPAEEVTDKNFEELFRTHVVAALEAQDPPVQLDLPDEERAREYVAGVMKKSRRWARAAALRQKMKPHSHPTVWFNAWKFGEQEQLWAALALALLEQLKTKYNFFERALFLVRLTLKRTDKRRVLAHFARKIVVPVALAAVAAVAYAPLSGWLKARYVGFVPSAEWAWLMPALAAAWQAWKAIENPFHLPIAEFVEQPDYREKVGFVGAFAEDFARIVETAVRRSFFWRPRKLAVFIDDLDRCGPLQAAGIVEAINLFLDSVGCVFILGMDMAAVATSIEVKYKELSERMRRDSPDLLSPGSLFLDKIVQIPFNVPRANRERIDALVTSITEPRAHVPRLALAPPPAETDEIATPPDPPDDRAAAAVNGHEAATTTNEPPAAGASDSAAETETATQRQPGDAATAAPKVDRGSFAREDIKQAVVYASRLLKENPRQVKRFVNLFRLQIYIADQRGLLSEEGEQGLTPKRLAVWVAWYMQWPEILKLLAGATYTGSELRENLAGISRRLVIDEEDEDCGVEWLENGKLSFLSDLASVQLAFKDSPSHWSKLPWQVWINDTDFLHCLKDLEPYWNNRRLLNSVADMTQFDVETPGNGATALPAARPALLKPPAEAEAAILEK
jgi:hypothetical protein